MNAAPADGDTTDRTLHQRLSKAERAALEAQWPTHAGWWQQGLLAVVMIQALGLSVLAVRQWIADPAPAYRTLSDAPVPPGAGAIRVVPDAAMALTDWNALLHVLRLRVVGGPDAAGAYTVVPIGRRATTGHILQQLRATRGVRLAEAVPATR